MIQIGSKYGNLEVNRIRHNWDTVSQHLYGFFHRKWLGAIRDIAIAMPSTVNDVHCGKETVKKATFEKKIECQEKIKNSIQGCSLNKVVFTTDLASDNVNHNSYLDFTVFWIDNSWTLYHAIYRCSYFSESN